MRIICNKAELQKGIAGVIKAAQTRAQKSILEAILFTAHDSSLILNTCDSVTAIETTVFADVKENGQCALPAKLLFDIINKMTDGEITIESNDTNTAVIKGAKSSIKLTAMDASQFPHFPEETGTPIEMKLGDLFKMVDSTAFSVYQKDDKPILKGLLFELDGEYLNVVGTNSLILAKRSEKRFSSDAVNAVIPARILRDCMRILGDDEDINIRLTVSRNSVFIVSENTKIYTGLLEGEFVKYGNIIPKEYKTRVRINTKMLENSLNMISVLSREDDTNPVKMIVSGESLELESKSEYGDGKDIIYANVEGDAMKMSFNAKFLLDILKAIDDEEIFIEFMSSLRPMVIKPVEGDDYLYLMAAIGNRD